MQYVKLVNGTVQFAPKKIKDGNSITYNPDAEMLTEYGYKPLVVDETPEVPDGYHLEPSYADEGETIRQSWNVVKDTQQTSYEGELLNILLGGEE